MLIAVASQNFRTVTAHAGKARRFILFEAGSATSPAEVGRIELPRELMLHEFNGSGPHPLDQADVVIAASAGPGFARKMAARGVLTSIAQATDPLTAVRLFLVDGLVPPPSAQAGACSCMAS